MIVLGGPFNTVSNLYNGIKTAIATHGGWTITLDSGDVSNPFIEMQSSTTIDGQTIKLRVKILGSGSSLYLNSNSTPDGGTKIGVIGSDGTFMPPDGVNLSPSSFTGYIQLGNDFLIIGLYLHGPSQSCVIFGGNVVSTPLNDQGLTGQAKLLYGRIYTSGVGLYVYKYKARNVSTGVATNGLQVQDITGVQPYAAPLKTSIVENGNFIFLTKPLIALYGGSSNAYGVFGYLDRIYHSSDRTNVPLYLINASGTNYLNLGNTINNSYAFAIRWETT